MFDITPWNCDISEVFCIIVRTTNHSYYMEDRFTNKSPLLISSNSKKSN